MYDLNCFVYVFLFHLRIVLTKLKILTLKVHISVFVIIIVLIQMKHGNWFNTTVCSASLDVTKTKARSASDNFMLWLITQSKGRTRKCIGKVSNLIRANVYLVLTSQIQARSSIVGYSGPTVDAQQVLKGTFKAFIKKRLFYW